MVTGTNGTTTDRTITGIRTVGVPVSDQDRALRFYRDQLGLQVRMDAPMSQLGGRWIEMAPVGAETTIALVPAGTGTVTGVDTGIRLSASDAPTLHRDLSARGVEVDELLRWEGVPPMFVLRDPDGNVLSIVQT